MTVTYKYDADGLRTQKTVNGVVYNYGYENGKLVYEQVGDDYEINYRYDKDGNLFTYTRTSYADGSRSLLYAVNNTRGDLVELRTGSGAVYAKYNYDSWGNLISVTNANGTAHAATHASQYNSIRYRGYVYDRETELYYLQSRYYDPETGRFLNADDVDYIGYSGEDASYNAFAYCENEPIRRLDVNGYVYSYADMYIFSDDVRIYLILEIAKEVLMSFLKNYLIKGYKIIENTINIEYYEKTGMFFAKVKYYKTQGNVNSIKLEYGDENSWRKSIVPDNLKSMGLALNFSDVAYESGLTTASKPGESEVLQELLFSVLTRIALLYTYCKAFSYLNVYNKVWGPGRETSNKKDGYTLFKVTSENDLNGYHLYCYDLRVGEEIDI